MKSLPPGVRNRLRPTTRGNRDDRWRQEVVEADLSPRGIIAALDLRRPIYEPAARYGHFGHAEFS
ncbi:MAG: methionine adenosyltransferase domain-containing protein [Proteobacteria bacterium]|nr:methionine adenosyltransferase domain-containing protein [Pseudomonadota bacterium]